MVVDLSSASDGGSSAQQRTRKKFLVARSHEQTNSIFDYVHLSSTLLRKVRFGQPIELAIQKPSHDKQKTQQRKAEKTSQTPVSWSPTPLDATVQHQHQHTLQSAKLLHAHSSSSSKYLMQPALAPERTSFLQYNSVVRFQASDGGYLLIESDGCLRKAPKEYKSDPRTLVTLFPRDPVANIAKQPKRIRSGDCAFLVQSSRTALQTDAGITRADSDEMIEGPAHLVSEVGRHDSLAVLAAPAEQPLHHWQSHHTMNSSHTSLTKQSIRTKQLERAFAPETQSMPTTVWSLVKVPARTLGRDETSETLAGTTDAYFCLGEQCQLFQNHSVICYELQRRTSEREREDHQSSLRPSSAAASMASSVDVTSRSSGAKPSSTILQSSSLSGVSSPTSVSSPTRGGGTGHSIFSHVWLQDATQFGLASHPTHCQCRNRSSSSSESVVWGNTWRICGVYGRESASSASRAALLTPTRFESAHRQRRSSARACSAPATAALGTLEQQMGDGTASETASTTSMNDSTAPHDDDALPSALTRQTSVYDVATFAARAEARQACAARIIVRFFQRLFRHDVTQSRVQDFLRRRRRLTHTERHVSTKLSATEQLALLQCYNPQLYRGHGLYERSKGASPPHRARHSVAFTKFTDSADADRQKLATMKCDVAYLNRDWLRTERHAVGPRPSLHTNGSNNDMYTRRPLSSPITPQRIVANRACEHAFLVQMKMAAREPPALHFGGARPHTAPLAALESTTDARTQGG